jgi:ABC-type transporter Mla maintaining outer membrane lipid asymmetry ATPase subunit MlaF
VTFTLAEFMAGMGLIMNVILIVAGGLLRYTVSEKDKQIQANTIMLANQSVDIATLKTEVAVFKEKHSTTDGQMAQIIKKLDRIEQFLMGSGRGSIHQHQEGQ